VYPKTNKKMLKSLMKYSKIDTSTKCDIRVYTCSKQQVQYDQSIN